MACSMHSSVGWGSCSHPSAGLKKLCSLSSFRCGREQLEICVASHSGNDSSEDAKRRWRASTVAVRRVAEDKAASDRKEGFGMSRRALLGLLAVALPPAVAFAEEEEENDSQKLFRQMKLVVIEKTEQKEREKAAVAAEAPPLSTVEEPEPVAAVDTSPEPELQSEHEAEPSQAYAISSEETSQGLSVSPDSETPTSLASASEAPPSSSESTDASSAFPVVPPPTPEAISQTVQQLESTPSAVEATLSLVTEGVTTELVEEVEGNVPVFVPFLGVAGTGLICAIFSIIGQPEVKYPSDTTNVNKTESQEKTLSD